MPNKIKLDKKLQVYITQKMYDNLDWMKEENSRTIADLVREAINLLEKKYKLTKST